MSACMGISSDVLIYGEDKGWSGNLDFWEIWCGFLKNPRQQCPKNKNLDPEHIRTPKIIEIGLETMENGHFEVGCTLIEIFFKNLDFWDRLSFKDFGDKSWNFKWTYLRAPWTDFKNFGHFEKPWIFSFDLY